MFGFFNYTKVSNEEEYQQEQEEKMKFEILNEQYNIKYIKYNRFMNNECIKIQTIIENRNKENENYDEEADEEILNMKILHNIKQTEINKMLKNYWENLQYYDWKKTLN
jgi:hypothetical protein